MCRAEGRALFSAHGYPVLECRRCQHRYAGLLPDPDHVAAVYDDHYFDGGGAGYADYTAESEILVAHGARYADLLKRHGITPGRQLDIGASCGFVMQGFTSRGWHGIGLEPNPGMAALGRRKDHLDIRVGTAEALPAIVMSESSTDPGTGSGAQAGQNPGSAPGSSAAFNDPATLQRPPEGTFDLISIIQVMAHFHDVRKALSRLRARTRPGGWWLLETWDYRSFSARIAGQHWHEYSPPSVLHWFSRQRLVALLDEYGLTAVAHGRPRKFLRGSHARSLLEHKLAASAPGRLLMPMTRAIPERLTIPYPADDLFWLLCRCDREPGAATERD